MLRSVVRSVIGRYFGLAVGLFFLLSLIGSGCSSSKPASSHVDPKTLSTTPSFLTAHVPPAQSAVYVQAKALYSRGNYASADRILVSLLTEPQWSAKERAFLQRQHLLCREALAEKSSKVRSVKTAKATPPKKSTATFDCGPRALLLLCQSFNPHVAASLPSLCKVANVKAPKGTSLEGMTKAAKSIGFAAEAVQMDQDALANLSHPAIAWVGGNHYLAVYKVQRSLRGIDYDTVIVQDPNKNRKEVIGLRSLLSRSGGILLTLKPS